jgi:tryptophan synthase alpha chain
LSTSFLYCVAYTGVTGQENETLQKNLLFFKFLKEKLQHPFFIGYGVKNRKDFEIYTQYADGVIIGSAFIQLLQQTSIQNRDRKIRDFVNRIIGC